MYSYLLARDEFRFDISIICSAFAPFSILDLFAQKIRHREKRCIVSFNLVVVQELNEALGPYLENLFSISGV